MSSTTDIAEIEFKAKRVLRTIVQVGIPAFLSGAVLLPQLIGALGLPVSSKLYLWLIGFAAGITAVAAALTRLMAIPAVNAFLVSFGLGSVPASATAGDHSTDEPVIDTALDTDTPSPAATTPPVAGE